MKPDNELQELSSRAHAVLRGDVLVDDETSDYVERLLNDVEAAPWFPARNPKDGTWTYRTDAEQANEWETALLLHGNVAPVWLARVGELEVLLDAIDEDQGGVRVPTHEAPSGIRDITDEVVEGHA